MTTSARPGPPIMPVDHDLIRRAPKVLLHDHLLPLVSPR